MASPLPASPRAADLAGRDRPPIFDSPAAEEAARRLIATRDPQGVFDDLVSFSMQVEWSGRVFEEFVDDPAIYRGRVFRVTSYPRLQTSIWHDFPKPGNGVVYTVIAGEEAVERLLFATMGDDGVVRVDGVVAEPLDQLRRKYKQGGVRHQLKSLRVLGGSETRRKGRRLKRMAAQARSLDGSMIGSLFGTRFAPRRGTLAYWSPADVFAFFGQAFSVYNWFPNSLASRHGVERVRLVEKRARADDPHKRLALDVTFPPWVRINPGKGGTMRFFLAETPGGGLRCDVLHYDLRFMAGGDKLLRAHHEMQGYREAEDGRGLSYPRRRWIRFRFKGTRQGITFPSYVEHDTPTGVDSDFALRANWRGGERNGWDRLVAAIHGGAIDVLAGNGTRA